MERADTIVVGAGQAGLATSYFLTQQGREHLVLERGRVAETWRSRRWDNFTLVGPNWTCALPGHEYQGDDPDGFLPLPDIVAFFGSYARSFRAPVREGVAVRRLCRVDDGYVLDADGGALAARNVVVATGAFQRAKIPADAAKLTRVFQIHTDAYRRPDQLPDGGVLVVGSGQSGCQIAEELRDSGRDVYLSTSGCAWYPRRYRGRDNVRWRDVMGFFDVLVETLPSLKARFASAPIQTGRDGGRDINLRTLAAKGVVLAGHFAGAEATRVHFAGDLDENLARSDQGARDFLASVDAFIVERGIAAPRAEGDLFFESRPARVDGLDLAKGGVATVLWATGFALDFGWIELPAFDEFGYPIQRQGVTAFPGLYFVGLHLMYKRKSGLIFGVGEDAQNVVEHIASRG